MRGQRRVAPALGGSLKLNGCPLPLPSSRKTKLWQEQGSEGPLLTQPTPTPGEGRRAQAGQLLGAPACPAPRRASLAQAWA